MKKIAVFFVLFFVPFWASASEGYLPDHTYLEDRAALDGLQQDAFRYMWEDPDPSSGMALESSEVYGQIRPVAIGGTGFGVAAIVTAVDRGWISREQALGRLLKIVTFLRDKTPRKNLHGAFPHWIDGRTGDIVKFSKEDVGADIVETALLMQGLLIARAYFNGPGEERNLREIITGLWEDVEWNWFTNGEEKGLYWHWTSEHGFSGLKILGFNECLIAYVLAAASPTYPISRASYDYWTSGPGYQPKTLYGYKVEAALPGGGPLFLTHYSFIGLDPRQMADDFVPGGYLIRNIAHTLSNREYCINNAPERNHYSANLWGLTASTIKNGYQANEPLHDSGTIAPTAALSAMPYTPHFSMQVLSALRGEMAAKAWGKYGPYDAFSLKDNWFSNSYLAIDQLPIVCMVENYRSGLLWNLFMSDVEVQRGLQVVGIKSPAFKEGFPEVLPTLKRKGKAYIVDAYDIRRHPDSGLYSIAFWTEEAGDVTFRFLDIEQNLLQTIPVTARKGRNSLDFQGFAPVDEKVLSLVMQVGDKEYFLPVRMH